MKNTYIDKIASLTPEARLILCDKETEHPYQGIYNEVASQGSYLCRRCGLALFRAHSQFSAGCGWPSFDAGLTHTIKESSDMDGFRVEIQCHRCDGHLGHVFTGEQFTVKNHRYCVNSQSIDFVEDNTVTDTEEAILAGGCFWGVEYFLSALPGVLNVEVGYTGGILDNPTYEAICSGNSGHYEAVRVVFDVEKTDYRQVLKRFFETHDPTQRNGQGPDLGQQYQSAIFYYNKEQQTEAGDLIKELITRGYDVATAVLPVDVFWPAEKYHQHYYKAHHKQPYCHRLVKRFKSV